MSTCYSVSKIIHADVMCDMYVCDYQCLCLKEEQKYPLVDIANINLDRITQMKYNILCMNSKHSAET